MAPRRKFTEADYDRMIEMRERGCTFAMIARKFECSSSAVSWHLLRLGVDAPSARPLRPKSGPSVVRRGSHTVRRYTPEDDKQLLHLEAQGLSMSEIARRLGRKPNSIRGRLYTLARYEARAEGNQ